VVGGLVVERWIVNTRDSLVLAVGAPSTKQSIVRRLTNTKCEWPKIVHHGAHVGADVTLERGVQVGATLAVGNSVGEFATVNLNASISHETKVIRHSLSWLSIGGNVSIGEGAFIGIGASVIQGITIGAWSVVGAGAVVIEDVEPNTVVAGVPARVIDRRPEGWQHG
jgi:acetyltransferase-like isoleucine patch superfamily enzyme